MPLAVEGKVLENSCGVLQDFDTFYKLCGHKFEAQAASLIARYEHRIKKSDPCLFVGQREIGSTYCGDPVVSMLGTDMMTTCHAVFVRCPATKATSLGVFDGVRTEEGVRELSRGIHLLSLDQETSRVTEKHYDLHVIGGFDDPRNISRTITMKVLQAFHNLTSDSAQQVVFDLRTFCCSTMNTSVSFRNGNQSKRPIIYGVAMTLKSGSLYRVEFNEDARCPAFLLRTVSFFFCPPKMWNIYDWSKHHVVIVKFHYDEFPLTEAWNDQSDDFILQHTSTSPEVEPPQFVAQVRRVLKFVHKHLNPTESVFKSKDHISYVKHSGQWMELGNPYARGLRNPFLTTFTSLRERLQRSLLFR